jgi:hypothetical protein
MFLLSYFDYRQIWLNILMDDCDLPLEQHHKIGKKRKKKKEMLPPAQLENWCNTSL